MFQNTLQFRPSSMHIANPLIPRKYTVSDNEIMNILFVYDSPLIFTIDGSFKPSGTKNIYPPHQSQQLTLAHVVTSVTITPINNSHPTKSWMNLPTIPLLFRVQSLKAAYGKYTITNNTAELLARIMPCELLLLNTPTIIIYDSTGAHIQHLSLIDTAYTN